MPQQFKKKLSDIAVGDPLETHDVNAIIRANIAFLRRQALHDDLEARYVAEHGIEWENEFRRRTLSFMTLKDTAMREVLTNYVREMTGDKNFNFQEETDWPPITLEEVVTRTRIPKPRLRSILEPKAEYGSGSATGGQPFTVDELLALAAAFEVTPAYLLTPPREFLGAEDELRVAAVSNVDGEPAVSTARWVLWLHNLLPLPKQNPYRFERNLSYSSAFVDALPRNRKPSKDRVIDIINRTRRARASYFSQLGNFGPPPKMWRVDFSAAPLVKSPRDRNLTSIVHANGIFFELRKALRATEIARLSTASGRRRLRNQKAKAMYHFDRMLSERRVR